MAIPMRLLGYPDDALHFLKLGEKLSEELGDKKNFRYFLEASEAITQLKAGILY